MTSKNLNEIFESESGFHKFMGIFTKESQKILDEVIQNPDKYKEFSSGLFEDDMPTLQKTFNPREKFFGRLFSGFNEIATTYFSLLDIEIYIGRFPYSDTNISKSRHLLYHIESHLNEVYILKTRLLTYITVIDRSYRNDSRYRDIIKKKPLLTEFVEASFDNIIKTRGQHVHESRITDKDIKKLNTLEILMSVNDHDDDEVAKYASLSYRFSYPAIRKEWKQKISSNNENIKKVLDQCFDILFNILADENFEIKYPSDL